MTFDDDLAIPAAAHELRQTQRIVGVRLVEAQRQRSLGVARIDADDGEALGFQPMIEPRGQLTGFETDPLGARCMFLQCLGNGVWRGRGAAAPKHFFALVDDHDRGLGQMLLRCQCALR
jgi:hypothetical protein